MKNRMGHQLASPDSPTLPRRRQRLNSNTLLAAGFQRLRLRTLSSSKKPPMPLRVDVPPVPCALHPAVPHSTEAVPSLHVVGPSESGSLPPNLSQLRGIHYVSDPNEDPNLDGETTSNTSQTQATRSGTLSTTQDSTPTHSPTDSGSFVLTMESSGDGHPDDSRLTPMASLSPTDEEIYTNKFLFPTGRSPDGKLSKFPGIRRLSPRACQAACPPIDLVSPHAPYAPTPPLSPRVEPVFPSSATPQRSLAFSFGKSLRRMPSTVMMLATNVKRSNMHVTRVPYRGNEVEPIISESTAQLQASSPSTSLEGNPLPLDVSSRDSCSKMGNGPPSASTYSIRSELSTASARLPQSHNMSGKTNLQGQATHYAASPPAVSEIAVGPFEQQAWSESNKSVFRDNLNTLVTVPIHRLRKSSSLGTLLRSIKSRKHLRAELPSEACASFEEIHRHLTVNVPTDSCCEVLDATAVSSCPVPRGGD